jgi:hypothetical protein
MIDEHHAKLGLQLHSLGEHLHELVHKGLTFGHVGIVNEDNALSFLLDRAPALLIFEITGNVPEF